MRLQPTETPLPIRPPHTPSPFPVQAQLDPAPLKSNFLSDTQLPIDSTGTLPDGTPFADFADMRKKISARQDDFARGFTEHLIEYGLGRPFGFKDLNLADDMISQARKERHERLHPRLGSVPRVSSEVNGGVHSIHDRFASVPAG